MAEISQRLASLSPAQRKLLEQRLAQGNTAAEPIALVGMACRFPGAPNIDAYWELICGGGCAIGEIPAERWDVDAFYDPNHDVPGKMSVRWGAFVEGVDQFDPMFFGITPREASRIDPQQRLLLEVAWEGLEGAGLAPERMAGTRTGVFVGIGGTDYSKIPTHYENHLETIDAHVGTGNALSIAANRLSYVLDLRGPSMAVDTACSSSLLALHLAINSLRQRECDAALAAGVNLVLSPEVMIAFSKARMLSPTGRCRPFDAAADGYVRGEGCGVLVVKRLSDAVRDGDRIEAVFRGSAANQDGRTSGITAPNSLAQHEVIRAALAGAGVSASQIGYFEAHGTGTPLGDPIEVQGLLRHFRNGGGEPPCYLGSVKANVGHTETASGMAGVIKVALMLRHGLIPAQANFSQLNPNIHLEGTRLELPREPLPWNRGTAPRLAGVSSYGFGGTNVHVVMEEPPPAKQPAKVPLPGPDADRSTSGASPALVPLSAKTETALAALAARFAEHVASHPEQSPADVARSAGVGRSHFGHRLAIVADSTTALAERLKAAATGQRTAGLIRGQKPATARPKVAMLFTGQGSQYVGMGRALYESEPLFRRTLDECDAILRDQRQRPLLEVLFPPPGADSPLDETAYTQPALFALEYALATLWRSWGIDPDCLLGHSVGEITAAAVAGVFSLADGLGLIAKRSQLMQDLPRDGAMAVVFAPAERIADAVAEFEADVSLAALNGPENTVVSGRTEAVHALLARFEAEGLRSQPLVVSHAFHSPLMEPILDEFEAYAAQIEQARPEIPLVSNLTGRLMDEAPTARYWRDHVRSAVRFAEGIRALEEDSVDIFLEVGPAPVLLGMGKRCLPQSTGAWVASLRRGQPDDQVLLAALGELYVRGARIDWPAYHRERLGRPVALPTYPFERSRHWLDLPQQTRRGVAGPAGPELHPLLGAAVASAVEETIFQSRFTPRTPHYLAEHQVQGSVVVPAAAYLEMGLAAAEQVFGAGLHCVADVSVQHPLFLAEGAARAVQVVASPEIATSRNYAVYSAPLDGADGTRTWTLHARGQLQQAGDDHASPFRPPAMDDFTARVVDEKTRDEFYAIMAGRGLAYGPEFQSLDGVRRSPHDALARLDLHPSVARALGEYHGHPVVLDAAIQLLAGVVPLQPDGSYSPFTYMPVRIGRFCTLGRLEDAQWVYAVRTSSHDAPNPETVDADLLILDADYRVVAELGDVRVQRLGRAALGERLDPRQWLYRVVWQQQQETPPVSPSLEGTWVVLADRKGVADELAKRLRGRGARCVLVEPGEGFAQWEDDAARAMRFRIDPLAGDGYRRVLEAVHAADASACRGVIHLWSLDLPSPNDACDQCLAECRRLGVGSALPLIQQLVRAPFSRPPELWLVTQGAQAAEEPEVPATAVLQSPLWGLGRVAAVEHPELACRLIDLAPGGNAAESAADLERELAATDGENQVAWRRAARRVARLVAAPEAAAEAGDALRPMLPTGNFRLRLSGAGSFDALDYERVEPQPPAAGQVELQVRATGLNFSDVLKAMGLYPGIRDALVPLGIECAGVVTRVGPGVERFRPGQAVMGVVPYGFASRAVTAEYALIPKPDRFSDEEAATLPIAVLTAHYALVHLAQLQAGERVLIHAGAGGVGLAAIRIAQHLGGEVFATAGSDAKRDYLRDLGVEHVLNSRTLEFADRIRETTGGEGVDVVLNSLPGEAITRSLATLRAYGRFVEIGKTDIYQNRMIGLLPFQDNLSYFALDLDRMLRQRPEQIRRLLAEIADLCEKGVYAPLAHTVFPAEEVRSAFRYMAQRKNIGKVVVRMGAPGPHGPRGDSTERVQRDEHPRGAVRRDGTYLVTGGLGALGRRLAEWLVERGAGCVVLLSRRQPDAATTAWMASLSGNSTRVLAVQGDVSKRDSLSAALEQIPSDAPPLRGVIHAAGVLDDGILFEMDHAQLDRALAPKLDGAWNLHALTLDRPLDFFVLFSSVAATLGSPGQANYAAGNALLDGLASYRASLGLPALAINWGPWGESGMAAEAGRGTQMEARGLRPLPPEEALELLERLIGGELCQAVVMDADWNALRATLGGRRAPLWEEHAGGEGPGGPSAAGGGVDQAFLDRLNEVPKGERAALLSDYFRGELGRIMGIPADAIDPNVPLNSLGLDSLMGMELKNNLEQRLAFSLPMARFMEGPSVTSLAQASEELLFPDQAGGRAVSGNGRAWSPMLRLREGTQREAVFCFHPLGGDFRCYLDLAEHFPGDWPIWALRARGAEGVFDPHVTLEEAVAAYIAAIRELQPTGPYHLAGWSAGGIYAYETARALLAEGEQVGLLALFDTPLPSVYDHIDLDDDARFLADLVQFTNRFSGADMEVTYEQLHRLDRDAAFLVAFEEARRKQVVPAEATPETIRRLVETGRSNARWIAGYSVQPLDVTVHLFRPEVEGALDDISGQAWGEDLGWRDVLGERLVLNVTPGDHFTMMTGPHAARLAELLARMLARSNGASRQPAAERELS